MSEHYTEDELNLDFFGMAAAAKVLPPWDSLQHLEKADKAVVDLLLRARNAVSPQTLQENEILGEMTITADLLLQHIRLFRERIDHFAGPNSASLSRQADMQLGDLAPGDIVPAPGPQWPDARNREVDMVIDQQEQSLSLMQAGHLKESMEAAADARQLTMALPMGFPMLALHMKEMKGRFENRARKEERLGVVFNPASVKTSDLFPDLPGYPDGMIRHAGHPSIQRESALLGLEWVMPWDPQASWNPLDTGLLWARMADRSVGLVYVLVLTGDWIDGRDASYLKIRIASGEGVIDGLAAWSDGVIPFADPFANQLGVYDPNDELLQWSQTMGGISRDALIATGGVGLLSRSSSTLANSRWLGKGSELFGRGEKFGYKGIFNRGQFRTGWGWKGGRLDGRDVFRTSWSKKNNRSWWNHFDWF